MAGTDQRFPVRSANFTLRQNITQNASNEKNFGLFRDGGGTGIVPMPYMVTPLLEMDWATFFAIVRHFAAIFHCKQVFNGTKFCALDMWAPLYGHLDHFLCPLDLYAGPF